MAASDADTPRASSGWKGTLFVLGLGTVLTLGVAEGGLRVAGWFLAPGAGAGGEITVLAEGDSFTYGIGGLSFPAQLQSLMDERFGPGRVRVVNEGIPGQSTALVADNLPAHLDRHNPQAVLVVIGENDDWNSVRLEDPEGALSLVDRLDRVALHSRVYKFLKVAWIGWDHPNFTAARESSRGEAPDAAEQAAHAFSETREVIGYPRGTPTGSYSVSDLTPWVNLDVGVDAESIGPVLAHIDALGLGELPGGFPPPELQQDWSEAILYERQGRYAEAVERLEELGEAVPGEIRVQFHLGTSLMREGRWDDAVRVLDAARALEGARAEVWFSLGHAHKRAGRREEALDAWVDGLRHFPLSRPLYQAVGATLHGDERVWETLDRVRDVPGIEGNLLHQYLVRIQEGSKGRPVQELVSDGMRLDVRRIVQAAHARGAEVIFASYPHIAFDEIEETATSMGARYIDFRPIFRDRFPTRDDYLSNDGCHCNTDGYRAMAEHFADELADVLGWSAHG